MSQERQRRMIKIRTNNDFINLIKKQLAFDLESQV